MAHIQRWLPLVATVFIGCAKNTTQQISPVERAKAQLLARIDDVDSAFARLGSSTLLSDSAARDSVARVRFVAARDAYKRVESAVEFFAPAAARQINGAPLDRVEGDAPDIILPAQGLQVIEAKLYPSVDAAALRSDVPTLVKLALGHVRRARVVIAQTAATDDQVWEAARLELIRLSTIDLGGFDSFVAERTATETARALEGVKEMLMPWQSGTHSDQTQRNLLHLDTLFTRAIAKTDSIACDREFDRLALLTETLLPVSNAIANARTALQIVSAASRSLLRTSAPSAYGHGAFDAESFRSQTSSRSNPAQLSLGAQLFSSTALSGDGTRSCATCHQPDRAFTDGLERSIPVSKSRVVLRNAPTLLNAALQGAQFADGRAVYLEDQVSAVVASAHELNGSLDVAAKRLSNDTLLVFQFRKAFDSAGKQLTTDLVTADRIRESVATYVRSLISLNAPFDRYVNGDTAAMTRSARKGFTIFMGKAKCGSCHFAPLFNGTVPPLFAETEYEVIGVPVRAGSTRIDTDTGRALITRAKIHNFAFKTATVRNATLTAPYMHNGALRSLDDVISFYEKGGGAGVGMDLPNQTLSFDKLELSRKERADLIAFIEALTDSKAAVARHGRSTTSQ